MECIVDKLRRENPEQFFVLVRMHLSFIVDINTDENDATTADKPTKAFKWGFSKKAKSGCDVSKIQPNPNRVSETFHVTEENVNQLYQLIDILAEEKNVLQEGIFRRTGSLSRQQQLRKLLSLGKNVLEENRDAYNVHDMASVLKGILADMPEPLLLNEHYQAYCHLASTCFTDGQLNENCETRLMGALRLLLLLLPTLTFRLTIRLLELLHRTASHESSNRMSPSALATMFTPHIMCLRKLSPEALHADSQHLQPVLSFAVERAPQLFVAPPQLVTDISAYLAKREQKRLLSPGGGGDDLDESVTERTAANTVYTFVDRKMAPCGSTTDTALAQLYAHIQALPESQNKRRLIKQFNRENGHGTPLQIQRAQKQKSIGQSLKKHIFNKSLMSKTIKRASLMQDQGFGYQSIVESPTTSSIRPQENTTPITEPSRFVETPKIPKAGDEEPKPSPGDSEDDLLESNVEVMNVPAAPMTPELVRRKLEADSELLLMTSTPHVRAMAMNDDDYEACRTPMNAVRRGSMSPITKSTQKMPRAMQESIMTPRSRKPVIISCDPIIPAQPIVVQQQITPNPSSDDSQRSFSSSSSTMSIKNDSDFVSTDESCPSKSYCIKYKRIKDADLKEKNESYMESYTTDGSRAYAKRQRSLDQSVTEFVGDKLSTKKSDETSLTDPFRQYLMCRSILTESPVDLSFDNAEFEGLNPDLSDGRISRSLLYCLDGNKPDSSGGSDRECLLNSTDSKENDKIDDEAMHHKKECGIANKRIAHEVNGDIDEAKKIILSKVESSGRKETEDFWNFDRNRVLRETNL